MLKIFCLFVAFLVLASCGKDRVDKVQLVTEEKKVEPTVVNQSSSGPNSPNIVRNGGKATVTYAGGTISVGDDLTPTVNLPAGQQFMYIISKTQAKELGYGDGSENLFVTKGVGRTHPNVYTVWKSGRTPQSWEAVRYIKDN